MNTQLESYIKVYDGFVSSDMLSNVLDDLEQGMWDKHTFYNPEDNSRIQTSKYEPDVFCGSIKKNSEWNDCIWNVVHQYVIDLDFKWWQMWTGFSGSKIVRYNDQCRMHEHCDHIYTIFDGEVRGIPILTVITCIEDNCEGGELEFFQGKKTIKLKAGQSIVFPSNYLYPHKVLSVKKGTRTTSVIWVY